MSRRNPYPTTPTKTPTDVAPLFWRSLEEKAGLSPSDAEAEFPLGLVGDEQTAIVSSHELNARFVPDGDPRLEGVDPSVSRRGFIKFGTAVTALFGLDGCIRRPVEKLVPYTHSPENMIPGVSSHFATVFSRRGEALGLLVESHEGRPTKVEGNPEHSASLGKTDLAAQASVFDLYDPDRSTSVMQKAEKKAFADFEAALTAQLKSSESDSGAKLRILMEPTNSPTFIRLRDVVRQRFPQAKFHQYSAIDERNSLRGTEVAFGKPLRAMPDYARAKVVLSLDCDFLQTEPGSVRATRLFADSRRLKSATDAMSRLYVVEPLYSTTGANADHRLRIPARDVERYLRLLATELNAQGVALGDVAAALGKNANEGISDEWIKEVAKDLVKNRDRALLVAGTRQPASVHALTAVINAALGSQVIAYSPIVDEEILTAPGIADLAKDMQSGKVSTLVILGGNPVYNAPADLKFGELLASDKVFSAHLSSHVDETSKVATWHVPQAHALESWGDARSFDGTWTVQQPLIAPLHGGKSDLDLMRVLVGAHADGKYRTGTAYDFVRETMHYAASSTEASFEKTWSTALQIGFLAKSGMAPMSATTVRGADVAKELAKDAKKGSGFEVVFAVDPKVGDGRQANNPWLQEMPDPMTRIVWDNAAHVSKRTADELGVKNGDMVEIKTAGGTTQAAIWIQPGHADQTIALTIGWGRSIGRFATAPDAQLDPIHLYPVATGKGRGFNAFPLRTTDATHFIDGATVTKLGKSYTIVQTQEHHRMEGPMGDYERGAVVYSTLDNYKETPNFPDYKVAKPKTLPLWKPQDYSKGSPTNPTGFKWGMNIDLTTCTGCNACVIACQAENNIPIVGKDQVRRGREMHWMRIDRYFLGDENDPQVAAQPVGCQQCEQAPCENVCPVNATAHSPEGLNDMAYNRCIGTRYCANNCPYKVRRFNYLEFQGDPMYGDLPETVKMQFNPNVTVRMRGVIEKCSYCVQRIQEGKIGAKRAGKALKDGDVVSACAQACPADAITFGDLNDPKAKVTEAAGRDRRYDLLGDIGTHPRTSYLGKIMNPNPAMKDKAYERHYANHQEKHG